LKSGFFKVALPSLMVILLSTVFIGFSDNQNLQGSTQEVKGRLYYQAGFEDFGMVPISLPPSIVLLSAGAKWAAGNGTNALYVNWYDNWITHHETDGVNWGPWPDEQLMQNYTFSLSYALNQSGLNVQFAGDIPSDLSGYDVVVIFAYWAVEPSQCSLVRNYLASGGGVVLLAGVPEFFRCYCKDWWTYLCPTANESLGMQEWFGNGSYVNTGGNANVTSDNPFGTNLLAGDTLMQNCGGSCAAIVDGDAQAVAEWENGNVFAFSREYAQGRLYYQAAFENVDPPNTPPNRPGPPGDVSGVVPGLQDGRVDIQDVAYVARRFGTDPSKAMWDPKTDFNGDNKINIADVAFVAKHFGQHL